MHMIDQLVGEVLNPDKTIKDKNPMEINSIIKTIFTLNHEHNFFVMNVILLCIQEMNVLH